MYSSEYLSHDYIHLNSCGIEYLNADINTIRAKGRVDYHILYIYKGRCYATKYNKEVIVNEGSLVVYYPHERQQYRFVGSDESISCYLHFSGTGCAELVGMLPLSDVDTLYVGKSGALKLIMEKMLLEHTSKKSCYQELCRAFLLEFFATAKRNATHSNAPLVAKHTTTIDNVCLLMHEHYADNLPLQYYADYCNLSLSRFAHIFTDIVGMSPIAYITKLKIEKATNLLTSTDLSISEIAAISGFSNQNYFGAIFKKMVGMAPNAYRNNK